MNDKQVNDALVVLVTTTTTSNDTTTTRTGIQTVAQFGGRSRSTVGANGGWFGVARTGVIIPACHCS